MKGNPPDGQNLEQYICSFTLEEGIYLFTDWGQWFGWVVRDLEGI